MDCLRKAYTVAHHLPPTGFSWTSHNLWKRAASDAYALGARFMDILYASWWSTNSTVLESKYIDFRMQPYKEARLLFGFLCKVAPR